VTSDPYPAELEILWRLTGRKTPGEHATALASKLQELRPRILEMMMEMVILELEQDPPHVALTKQEIEVLLRSADARIRTLGIRLTPLARS
jgi:hypothetical protein